MITGEIGIVARKRWIERANLYRFHIENALRKNNGVLSAR
jgi:hypothetical protein